MNAPECSKISAVKDKSHAIGEFMDWLGEEKHWTVCETHHHDDDCFEKVARFEGDEDGDMQRICGCREGELIPVPIRMEELLAEFFEIDLDKVEEERRAILDQQRAVNAYHDHLDVCTQCEQHPFNQCPTGQELLVAAGKEAMELLGRRS
jgi:hypothetical protein